MSDPRLDPTLRRIERNALLLSVAAAVVALILAGGAPDAALGVLGGGALVAGSYWVTRSALEAMLGGGRASRARWAVLTLLRYALLALAAYVMIARFRLHPVGLLVGASAVVVSVSLEAARLLVGARGTE